MTKDEALRLALEALSEAHYVVEHRQDVKKREQAITAIKAALEAKDEPVAWKETDELECPICKVKAYPYPKCGHVKYVDEQEAFENWLSRNCPSGDAESVQYQWASSSDYADLYTTPPQQEAKDEPVVWNEGVPAMLPKQKEGETFIVSYEPKLEAKDEPVAQWQKKHATKTEGKWENTNGPDARWWLNNSVGWEIRALYTHPPQSFTYEQVKAHIRAASMSANDISVGSDTTEDGVSIVIRRRDELLYAEFFAYTPPQRKPLTDEEIGAILEGVNAYGTRLYTFARAIEAAHGIKGEK